MRAHKYQSGSTRLGQGLDLSQDDRKDPFHGKAKAYTDWIPWFLLKTASFKMALVAAILLD